MGLKRTPLYETHRSLGARFVEFAGWEMPVQYAGVRKEHLAVRSGCGLFDISHMGEIEVSGPGALGAVQRLTTNNVRAGRDNRCLYTLICNPDGGVVDDCIVYCFSPERFLFCVNASNTSKVFDWIKKNVDTEIRVSDLSESYVQLALQGPAAVKVLCADSDADPEQLKPFRFVLTRVFGVETILSRTGYTGEDGFELLVRSADPGSARRLWQGLAQAGRPEGLVPCGLGARDTLRIEMGYPLYGRELSEETTPFEAGLERFVSLGHEFFIGKEALEKQVTLGTHRRLVGLRMKEPGIARSGYAISAVGSGSMIGEVTSGTYSPSLDRPVAMGFVEAAFAAVGTEVEVLIRGSARKAVVSRLPFYKRRSAAGVA